MTQYVPFAEAPALQVAWYGAAVTVDVNTVLYGGKFCETINVTDWTPEIVSVAIAVNVTLSRTVAPFAGDVRLTVGG